jgi:hypothetical protein
MTIYEITANVDKNLTDSFEKFMGERHMTEVVDTGYFESAEMTLVEDGKYVIRYRSETRELLDEYLKIDAKKLRSIFLSEFPTGVKIAREIYEETEPLDASLKDLG